MHSIPICVSAIARVAQVTPSAQAHFDAGYSEARSRMGCILIASLRKCALTTYSSGNVGENSFGVWPHE